MEEKPTAMSIMKAVLKKHEERRAREIGMMPGAVASLPPHIQARAHAVVRLCEAAGCYTDKSDPVVAAVRDEFDKLLREGVIAACILHPTKADEAG